MTMRPMVKIDSFATKWWCWINDDFGWLQLMMVVAG